MKTAALRNLGCKVNEYETEAMEQLLIEDGYTIVPFDSPADVYLVNTCSVTNIADRKSRQMLHRARRMNPDAVVIACGCYVQTAAEMEAAPRHLDPELAEELALSDLADILIGNNKKSLLIPTLHAYLRQHRPQMQLADINFSGEDTSFDPLVRKTSGEKTRAFIKIQDGCDRYCSYCVIPYARGRVRSRRPQDVLNEIAGLASRGYREVILSGIHIGSYGKDFENSKDFEGSADNGKIDGSGNSFLLDLIERTAGIDGIDRIRIGSIEPMTITEKFADRLSRIDEICPQFHLSLQSGCDATLKRMNRKYTTKEFERCCEILRRAFDHPALTTDVITGFPGETEEEFEETVNFLRRIDFYELHVFPYSRRRGTPADQMPGQLSEKVKKERAKRLIELGRQGAERYRRSMIGRPAEVLFEERILCADGIMRWTGYTREYIRCLYDGEGDYSDTVLSGKLAAPKDPDSETLLFLPDCVK